MIGPYGLLAYAVCAGIVALIALCFAEVSSRYTRTGGPYLYTTHAFGATTGFAVGWLMWLTRVSAAAAICHVMTSYLSFFWAPAADGVGRAIAIGAALSAVTAINVAGIRHAAAAGAGFAVAKLVPLALFIGAGLFFIDPAAYAGAPPPAAVPFSQAVLVLIFAFVGFETTTVTAGEARNPTRDIPIALLAGIGIATVFYVLIQIVCIGVLPDLATSTRPLADAALRIAGPLGGAAISLGAVVSTTGTLFASLITGPRVLFAMARDERLPAIFAATHARFHTPHAAILVTGVAALLLAWTGTFIHLATLSVIARLSAYVATALALLVFRRRDTKPAPFRLRAGGLIVALACAACVWLLTTSALREVRDVAFATAVGFVLYAAHAVVRRASAGRA
jgi:amino acid transporter